MNDRKNKPYKEGELETILSLVPSHDNLENLSKLLDRSIGAIEIVYEIAYGNRKMAKGIQRKKVMDAKKRLNIKFGPQS